ncbi:MAG: methylenetetrahydrofolate reductase [Deltaproteobacteria bacterium RBG_16_49_23]|nr:MAG: methylenetetrahydrofolate reductase [Deltaproteobacteria bacterium RBG_16_49_23]OGQ12194.1 MAG: methylenetetrahydrofolate reductase [Deltaproteobacteria bacterium RBG_19FT_COMBO_46_12]
MKLEESLKCKRFIVTSEIQPPIGTGIQDLVRNIDKIRGRIDALTVPELKIEGLVTDTMGTCRALKDQRFDPILQTTCREKSRVDIQDHLIKACESGIENILTFTEDYRITGDSLQEIMFFHVDSGKLFSVIENLHEGHDISGRELPVRPRFCVGSGIDSSWGKKVPDLELKEMEDLAGLGTQYFLTTPIFDLDSFNQFMNRVGPIRIPVIAEIILVRSAEMGLFLNKHVKPGMVPNHIIEKLAKAPDKEKASIEIVSDLVKGLKDLCQGVHFIPIGAEDRISKYLDAIKL